MIIDSNLIYNLKNGCYSLRGALDTYGRMKIIVFDTKKGEYFYTDLWHDSTKWISLQQSTKSQRLNQRNQPRKT